MTAPGSSETLSSSMRRIQAAWVTMAGLAVISAVSALASGGLDILLKGLAGDPVSATIMGTIRLPRVLMAAVVGANLAVSGAALQALFRNPLASPFLLGVSGGAALGATISIVFLSFFPWPAPAVAGFFAALLTARAVFWVARSASGSARAESLLLAGVMMNSFSGALILLFQYLSGPGKVYQVVFWMMGSIQSTDLKEGFSLVALSLPAWILLFSRLRLINTFTLGEDVAGTSGIDVERFKRLLYWSTSWLVAVTVSVAGIIPFVGLVVPHIVRRLFGADHRLVIPGSLFGGAAFLLLSDALARSFLSPMDFPPGIVTSLIGTPFFFWVLRQTEAQGALSRGG
jgi:iron complex transport system permease protein